MKKRNMNKKPVKLTSKEELEIIPTSPFHFNSTFFKPAHFPSSDTKWESGKRWQAMLWKNTQLGLIFRNAGTSIKPRVKVDIFSAKKLMPEFLEKLKQEFICRYNLNLDLKHFYDAVKNEPALKDTIGRFHGLRPMHPGSLYEYLIIAIVLQNAPVRRSVYMMHLQ